MTDMTHAQKLEHLRSMERDYIEGLRRYDAKDTYYTAADKEHGRLLYGANLDRVRKEIAQLESKGGGRRGKGRKTPKRHTTKSHATKRHSTKRHSTKRHATKRHATKRHRTARRH